MDTIKEDVPEDKECPSEPIIKSINKDTVHKICSGQVVLSLSIAMKELVENAIDAGATIIDIHLKQHGSELLEVCDNGSGVLPENFQTLTLKHYTSKIREFNDLQSLETLGFRGEALSSLCALSDLIITTRHRSLDIGTKITYDHNGKITSTVPIARETGTTVTLSKLFSSLPVRRKEFTKNLKREFNKMCQLLYAYCLVSKGIKFTCSNTTDKGSKNVIVSTDGQNTVRENIINVFGPKQISDLINVELVTPDEQIFAEFGIKITSEQTVQFSFEFLISSVIHGTGRSTTDRQFYFINNRPCELTKIMKIVNEVYKQFNSHQYPFVYLNVITKSALVDVNITPDKRQVFIENEKILLATVKASLLAAFKQFPSTFKLQNADVTSFSQQERGLKRNFTDSCLQKSTSMLHTFRKKSKTTSNIPETKSNLLNFVEIKQQEEVIENVSIFDKIADKEDLKESQKQLDNLIELACNLVKDDNEKIELNTDKIKTEDLEISLDQPKETSKYRKSVPFNISLDQIKMCQDKQTSLNESIKIKFRSEIKSEQNKSAEEELQRHIQKSDFNDMSIIGQFNKGFIITRLKDDLFIIDQHASDEKYNFEMLQLNTVVDSQVLVNPKPLELTAGNEDLLIEKVEVFKKVGFSFKIDTDAPCTKKISLTSIPISRNFVFAKDDIDEMLLMLQESTNGICIPSKLKKMFASRACRKSVMIGRDLSKAEMKKLVEHMGAIDQPWNCPHGRPTMRHLVNLRLLESNE
ncbi:unnamed protein product [Phyllotreta striolata]|uniref:Mismatch repair endonuclease PMS2 n=1 Tax=Phyllotreta striolata TaxID=444603 RepID=A0A9N9TYH5_PHYSR|nr:unnamed protein product [Phyllotreta striolata]